MVRPQFACGTLVDRCRDWLSSRGWSARRLTCELTGDAGQRTWLGWDEVPTVSRFPSGYRNERTGSNLRSVPAELALESRSRRRGRRFGTPTDQQRLSRTRCQPGLGKCCELLELHVEALVHTSRRHCITFDRYGTRAVPDQAVLLSRSPRQARLTCLAAGIQVCEPEPAIPQVVTTRRDVVRLLSPTSEESRPARLSVSGHRANRSTVRLSAIPGSPRDCPRMSHAHETLSDKLDASPHIALPAWPVSATRF
jgi:hypothetical protein